MSIWDQYFNQANQLANQSNTLVSRALEAGIPFAGTALPNISNKVRNDLSNKITEIIPKIPFDDTYKAVLSSAVLSSASEKSVAQSASKAISSFPKSASQGATDIMEMTGGNAKSKGFANAVTLVSTVNPNDEVVFNIMPAISESRSASYEEIQIAHHPGAILKYQTTSVRSWGISGIILASRTKAEASNNQRLLNLMRSWLMPYYGAGTEKSFGANFFGAPPDVLKFSAYGDKNIGPVPVVLESLNVNWPNDVDYISTTTGEPFPVLIHIDISLKESWSPREFTGFDLSAYKQGDMTNSYIPDNSSKLTSAINQDQQKAPAESIALTPAEKAKQLGEPITWLKPGSGTTPDVEITNYPDGTFKTNEVTRIRISKPQIPKAPPFSGGAGGKFGGGGANGFF